MEKKERAGGYDMLHFVFSNDPNDIRPSGSNQYKSDQKKITKTHVIKAKNSITSMTCEIHYFDPVYSIIRPKITHVAVFEAEEHASFGWDSCLFIGRIYAIDISRENGGTKKITCESFLGNIKDAIIFDEPLNAKSKSNTSSPFKKGTPVFGSTLNGAIFNQNYGVNQFAHGELNKFGSAILSTPNMAGEVLPDDINCDGENAYNCITEIADAMKWEFREVYTLQPGSQFIGKSNIEFSRKFGSHHANTPIKTGLNLKDIRKTTNSDELFTAIMPFGGYGYGEKRLSLTDYPLPSPIRLTENGTINDIYNENTGSRHKIYATNVDLAEEFGLYIKPVIYDEIVANDKTQLVAKRQELVNRAKEDAKKLGADVITFDISAYDLNRAGYTNVDPFVLYDTYPVIDTITDTNIIARIVQTDVDYDSPLDSSFTFEYKISFENSDIY
jgi:hypothetical protein